MKKAFLFVLVFFPIIASGIIYASNPIINYPRGNIMYCEVTCQIQYVNGTSVEKKILLQASYDLVIPDPSAGFPLAVAAAKISRIQLWDSWKERVEEMEKQNPKIDNVAAKKTLYYTNKTPDRLAVTSFIRNYVSSSPGNNAGGVPSDFLIEEK